MRNSFLRVYDRPAQKIQETAEILGHIIIIMKNNPAHANREISYLSNNLLNAILQKNIKIYFNIEGFPVGYIAWAYLDSSTELRIMKTNNANISAEEWNCGNSLWIMDFLAPSGNLIYILNDLRDDVFLAEKKIRYFRIRNEERIYKELTRNKKNYFFLAPSRGIGSCTCGKSDCPAFKNLI